MLGAIAGDIIGSVYERRNVKTPDFRPLFHPRAHPTDDTVLTVAVADAILLGADLTDKLRAYHDAYPLAGYGGSFRKWALSLRRTPYNSWGNGSAMRASPVGFAYDSLEDVLLRARWSAEVTHNHPEGVKGAQAVAAAVFLARTGATKDELRDYVAGTFGYDLGRTVDGIRPTYGFDVSCQGSVPEAIVAFLESSDYEDAVRKAVSLGGDSDTIACIAGGIAHAFYGSVPKGIRDESRRRLNDHLLAVVDAFAARFPERRGRSV